jgi:hypothetical protein|tara:strand:+ start:1519 stop:2790 length:1272 start_codon:yes stop_codon:yes gene_type:complete
MNFTITENEGLKYSKISGDYNKIHIDEKTGYNSIFGEKICHGTLVITKIFKLINLEKIIKNQKKFSIDIKFFKHSKYCCEMSIIKKKNIYHVFQDNQKSLELKIINSNYYKFKNISKKKKLTSFINKYLNKESKIKNIYNLLNIISKYVGTIYPGENSLIKRININLNGYLNFRNKKIEILSKKIDPRFPIIENRLSYGKFIIEFQTLERPVVKKNKKIITKILKKKIKKIKYNALIIGSSQGIGLDVLNILKQNSKITKIATFNKNKIKNNNNKIIPIKIDVFNELNSINKIIDKYLPIKIFYFVSPKIYIENKLNPIIKKQYKFLFLEVPLMIINQNKSKNISFFYPSTSYIYEYRNSFYSKIKLNAEKKIRKLCLDNNILFRTIRFPTLNSRQSISLNNPNPPSLFQYLESNPKMVNKIF